MQRDVCKKVRIGIKGTKGRRVLSELNRRLLEDIFHFQRNRTEIDVNPTPFKGMAKHSYAKKGSISSILGGFANEGGKNIR